MTRGSVVGWSFTESPEGFDREQHRDPEISEATLMGPTLAETFIVFLMIILPFSWQRKIGLIPEPDLIPMTSPRATSNLRYTPSAFAQVGPSTPSQPGDSAIFPLRDGIDSDPEALRARIKIENSFLPEEAMLPYPPDASQVHDVAMPGSSPSVSFATAPRRSSLNLLRSPPLFVKHPPKKPGRKKSDDSSSSGSSDDSDDSETESIASDTSDSKKKKPGKDPKKPQAKPRSFFKFRGKQSKTAPEPPPAGAVPTPPPEPEPLPESANESPPALAEEKNEEESEPPQRARSRSIFPFKTKKSDEKKKIKFVSTKPTTPSKSDIKEEPEPASASAPPPEPQADQNEPEPPAKDDTPTTVEEAKAPSPDKPDSESMEPQTPEIPEKTASPPPARSPEPSEMLFAKFPSPICDDPSHIAISRTPVACQALKKPEISAKCKPLDVEDCVNSKIIKTCSPLSVISVSSCSENPHCPDKPSTSKSPPVPAKRTSTIKCPSPLKRKSSIKPPCSHTVRCHSSLIVGCQCSADSSCPDVSESKSAPQPPSKNCVSACVEPKVSTSRNCGTPMSSTAIKPPSPCRVSQIPVSHLPVRRGFVTPAEADRKPTPEVGVKPKHKRCPIAAQPLTQATDFTEHNSQTSLLEPTPAPSPSLASLQSVHPTSPEPPLGTSSTLLAENPGEAFAAAPSPDPTPGPVSASGSPRRPRPLDLENWLRNEYLSLARDVARRCSNNEINDPRPDEAALLEARRYVLNRLAELMEKKQMVEYEMNRRKNRGDGL